ncbi:MAG: class I tRNA ligase family protein, partial [Nanoarchaeota archaeon]
NASKTEDGTGLVHCAPGCGPEDYEVSKEYGIGIFNTINERGDFEDIEIFNNLKAKKDDKKFVEILKERGVLIAEKQVEHEYAHCWRCRNPVVFRATEQWFMRVENLIHKILEENKKVKWTPSWTKENFDLWISNLRDNGITRQRYWGCPAPIWQCENCDNIEVIGSADELKDKAGKIPQDLHRPWIDTISWKCKKCKREMKRIPDVIDVWVDSGTASWNCLYYPYQTKYFKDYFPADFILEATEQIKLWFSLLQMCSMIAFGKSAYKNVYCHGMILDYQGIKMSKSLGNIISPYEVVDKYGADILRYYMCEIAAGENINFNWEDVKVKQRNLDILWNLHSFLIDLNKQIGKKNKEKPDIEEKWIISMKNSAIDKVTRLLDEYKIDQSITEIERLFLELSRTYIKMVREKEEKEKVYEAVKEVYIDVLKMLSVISPFIAEKIWQNLKPELKLKEESVHLCVFPKADKKKINKKLEEDFEIVKQIVERGLSERDRAQIGLKWPLANAKIYCERSIKEMEEVIARQLNVKKIEFVKNKEIKVELD